MPPDDPETLGPRRAALAERRRKQRWQHTVGAIVVGAAVVTAAVVFGGGNDDLNRTLDGNGAIPTLGQGEDRVITTVLVGTREGSDESNALIWVTLLSFDTVEEEGAVVYVPAHTAVEVPGRGLHGLNEALTSGGIPLLLVSLENLLGTEIDRYVEISDRDARALFEATGSVTVDVPSQVRVAAGGSTARIIFDPGAQHLSPEFMVRLLYTVGIDSDDEELGSRHLAFWDAFFDTFGEDPESLRRAVNRSGAALAQSDVSVEENAGFLTEIASIAQPDRRVTVLPVTQVSVGGDELYSADSEEILAFVQETLGELEATGDDVRVQILNGNGVPGIGQEVAQILVGKGYRVILSGNARHLNYKTTLIVTYDDSAETVTVAERARDLLGVGEVQIAAQQQGIVDLTIVVGRDFVEGN